MKAVISVLVSAVCSVAMVGLAVEVPLPGLVGDYPADASIVVSVDFGQPIPDVSQVYLEIEGTLSPSWYIAAGDTLVWYGGFSANFLEGPGWWMAGMETGGVWEGEFSSLAPFRASSQANPDILLDGRGDLTIDFAGAGFTDVEEIGPYPRGTITSAALIYSGPVKGESATWGAVKALFSR